MENIKEGTTTGSNWKKTAERLGKAKAKGTIKPNRFGKTQDIVHKVFKRHEPKLQDGPKASMRQRANLYNKIVRRVNKASVQEGFGQYRDIGRTSSGGYISRGKSYLKGKIAGKNNTSAAVDKMKREKLTKSQMLKQLKQLRSK